MSQKPNVSIYGNADTNKRKRKPSIQSIIDEAKNGLSVMDPTKPLTMDQLNAAMQSAITNKYGSAQHDLKDAIGQSTQRQKQIPVYYQQYLNTLQGLQGAQQGAYNAAATASKGDGTDTLNNLFAGSLASRGQNAYDASQTQIAGLPQMQLGASQAEGVNQGKLQGQLSQLDTEAGQYGNEWLIDAIQKERDNEINRMTLEAATGKQLTEASNLDTEYMAKYGLSQADIADGLTPAEEKIIQKHQDSLAGTPKPAAPRTPHAPVDGIDYDTYLTMSPEERRQAHKDYVASGRAPGGSNGKDKYGNTVKERRANQNAWKGVLKDLRLYNKGTGTLHTQDEYDNYLAASDKQHPTDLADIGTYWAANKAHLTQDMIDALHALGISIGPGHGPVAPKVNPRLP